MGFKHLTVIEIYGIKLKRPFDRQLRLQHNFQNWVSIRGTVKKFLQYFNFQTNIYLFIALFKIVPIL